MIPRWARCDVEVGGLDEAQQDVLDVLADVAGLGQRGRVGDAEGHVEDLGQRLGQQRLAGAGGADQQDVGLAELDVVDGVAGVDALVVVVDRDGEDLLGLLLADDVRVELVLDLARAGERARPRPSQARGVSSISSSMISWQRLTHSSQMYTPWPAMSLRTCSWLLPQKQQRYGTLLLVVIGGRW